MSKKLIGGAVAILLIGASPALAQVGATAGGGGGVLGGAGVGGSGPGGSAVARDASPAGNPSLDANAGVNTSGSTGASTTAKTSKPTMNRSGTATYGGSASVNANADAK
jgi:hypothetical protein